jgi:pimeloyl-ACP methyl ester carboxylesterase
VNQARRYAAEVFFAFVMLAASPLYAATTCGDLKSFSLSGQSLTIQRAEVLPAGLMSTPSGAPPLSFNVAAHCRVDGIIGEHKGLDGKSYGIHFTLAMPKQWNGRLLYQGGGGLNGSVAPPLGSTAAGESPALARGFAVVGSDSGHQGSVFDASFFADQQAALDFLYLSIGKVMTVARVMVETHYGRAPTHRYFVGCSTGGREAMIAAQRYPDDFDGIVAGAPAMRTNYSNLATRWVTTQLNGAAPKDAQGHADAAKALSPADRQLILGGLLKACDALDGVRDGMIFNVRQCAFDPQALVCHGPKSDGCLAPEQAQAVKRAFAGPTTAAGRQVYPGFFYDTGIAAQGPGIPGLLNGGMSPVGPSPTGIDMNVDAEAALAHDAREMAGDTDSWTNLSTFTAHGGKLIFYHGVSDPWFSARDTLDYYQRLATDNPSTSIRDWSRFFLVPGMGHCGGGDAALDRFDMLSAIVDWVEQGRAPARVVATGAAFPHRSRPLCPSPEYAQYRGSGDTEAEASFSCSD